MANIKVRMDSRKNKSLQDHLIRAKIPKPRETVQWNSHHDSLRMQHCHYKGCRYCPKLHRQKVDCKSNNLVYILTCTKCGQQYVGETTCSLGEHISEHMRDIRYTRDPTLAPPSWLLKDPTPVGRHWGQSSHAADDLQINILSLIQRDPKDDYTTLYIENIEYQWIHRLSTMAPFGINVKIHDQLASG